MANKFTGTDSAKTLAFKKRIKRQGQIAYQSKHVNTIDEDTLVILSMQENLRSEVNTRYNCSIFHSYFQHDKQFVHTHYAVNKPYMFSS